LHESCFEFQRSAEKEAAFQLITSLHHDYQSLDRTDHSHVVSAMSDLSCCVVPQLEELPQHFLEYTMLAFQNANRVIHRSTN